MRTKQSFEIDCPPDTAFDGFTNAAKIVEWWGSPDAYKTLSWQADLREGGHWRAEFGVPGSERFGAAGEYLTVKRPARLEWTWRADWEPEVEKTIDMRFQGSPEGTTLIVETSGYQSREALRQDEEAWVTIIGWFSHFVTGQAK